MYWLSRQADLRARLSFLEGLFNKNPGSLKLNQLQMYIGPNGIAKEVHPAWYTKDNSGFCTETINIVGERRKYTNDSLDDYLDKILEGVSPTTGKKITPTFLVAGRKLAPNHKSEFYRGAHPTEFAEECAKFIRGYRAALTVSSASASLIKALIKGKKFNQINTLGQIFSLTYPEESRSWVRQFFSNLSRVRKFGVAVRAVVEGAGVRPSQITDMLDDFNTFWMDKRRRVLLIETIAPKGFRG